MNKAQVFILLGRSGCGKGTQAELLIEHLNKNQAKNNQTLRIESGNLIRNFSLGNSYTEKGVRRVMEAGILIPEAVIVSLWMNYLKENFTGEENIVFDGAPRKLREAQLLNDTLQFYGFEKPRVIVVNVGADWSEKRLLGRARKDDKPESIKNRLGWFETEVIPTIEYFKNNPYYGVIEVNGEQPIEDVHNEILAKIGLNL